MAPCVPCMLLVTFLCETLWALRGLALQEVTLRLLGGARCCRARG